ncbi:MAG TPA: DUF4833 domain-containing protein [Polyangiaceae bacterium]
MAAAALLSTPATGDSAHDVPSAFYVSKSENRNQVHYAVRLDDQCAPAGAAPVLPYWRMLERDARATEPLLSREVPAYGIAEQSVVSRGERGGVVRVVLRALPSRSLLLTTFASGQGCAASASLVIGGTPATLTSIHVQLRWPWGVDYLLLSGRALSDGHAVSERIAP